MRDFSGAFSPERPGASPSIWGLKTGSGIRGGINKGGSVNHSDQLKNIVAFVQAARHGSFSAAARANELTPAAISKNVADLERSFGVRLFNRTTRSLSLTEEGLRFFRQVESALDLLDRASEDLVQRDADLRGKVRISVSNVIGRHLIMPLMADLTSRHPKLELMLDFEDRVIDFVQTGHDLVIRGGLITESSMISRPISPLRLCLVAAPAYLKRHGVPEEMADLVNHRLIVHALLDGKIVPWSFRDVDGSIHPFVLQHRVLTLSDPEAMVQAVLDGIGIAQVPVYVAWPFLREKRVQLLMQKTHWQNDYQLVMQYAHRRLVQRVRVVAEYLLERLAQEPSLHVDVSTL